MSISFIVFMVCCLLAVVGVIVIIVGALHRESGAVAIGFAIALFCALAAVALNPFGHRSQPSLKQVAAVSATTPEDVESRFRTELAEYDKLLAQKDARPYHDRDYVDNLVYRRCCTCMVLSIKHLDEATQANPSERARFAQLAVSLWSPKYSQMKRFYTTAHGDGYASDGRDYSSLFEMADHYTSIIEPAVSIAYHVNAGSE